MKKTIFFLLAVVFVLGMTSCKKCKTCYTEVMGIKSPEQKYCGDELKQIEKVPGITCE